MSLRRVLSRDDIEERIQTLSEEVGRDYCERNPLLLGVLKGSIHFLSDLSRALSFPHEIDFLRVDTYRAGTQAEPTSRVEHFSSLDLVDRDVLIVDEILDRGYTSQAIETFMQNQKVNSFEWAFLLLKVGARSRANLDPKYVGFEFGDEWVVGYGMDLDEGYRHLPEIYEMDREERGS